MKKIEKLQEYLQQVDEKVIVKKGLIEVSFPEYYFTKKLANKQGEIIETLGIFNFIVYDDLDKKKIVLKGLFEIPTAVKMKPSTSSALPESELDLDKEEDSSDLNEEYIFLEDTKDDIEDDEEGPSNERYFVMEFVKGDEFFTKVFVVKNKFNTDYYFNAVLTGSHMKNIPYGDLPDLLLGNARMNGINFGVGAVTAEAMLSELCRDPDNMGRAYRFYIGKEPDLKKAKQYRSINVKRIAQLNSTFTAVSFEDMTSALIMSVNRSRSGGKETYAPMEELIYY